MALSTLGACFLPYGFERQTDGKWVAFNREYFPLFVSVELKGKKIEQIASRQSLKVQPPDGQVERIFLYNDGSAPWLSNVAAQSYFSGPHGLPVGDGSGGESVMPPQQRKIIAMRA